MVFPLVVGSGKRLFSDGPATATLVVTEVEAAGGGIVMLTYQPARPDSATTA